MRNSRFIVVVFIVCFAATGVFAGGGQEAVSSQEVVNISLGVSAGTLSEESLRAALEEFHQLYPHIRVDEIIYITADGWADYFTQIRTLVASGNPPDVVRVAVEGVPFMVEQNMALPLNSFLDEYPDIGSDYQDYHPNLQRPWEVDGDILAFTWDWNNVVTHINTDMLDDVGLPFPDADWDMDTFLHYAQTLTRTVDGNRVFGTTVHPTYFNVSAILYNFGAQFLTDDMTASALDSPEAMEAFQFLYDLIYTYEVAPRPDPGSSYIPQFLADQVAMAIGTGRSPIRHWVEGNKNFNIQYVPSFRTNQVIFGSGGWPVLRMTEHPDEAFLLSSFLGGVYSQSELLSASGIPSRISVMEAVLPDAPPENSMLYRRSADVARVVQAPQEYTQLTQVFNRYYSLLMADEISPQEAVTGMHNGFNSILSRRR